MTDKEINITISEFTGKNGDRIVFTLTKEVKLWDGD